MHSLLQEKGIHFQQKFTFKKEVKKNFKKIFFDNIS